MKGEKAGRAAKKGWTSDPKDSHTYFQLFTTVSEHTHCLSPPHASFSQPLIFP